MKTTTWTKESGLVTVVVLFENGTSGAESANEFTPEEAKAAVKWLKKFCGDGYSKNNIPWTVTNPQTGETRQVFHRRNFATFGR
jgi:hypothetical protein|tara:strand:+ start:27 stop:278 length:252 start_codon:yes stop_codon:yes gene_type:complete